MYVCMYVCMYVYIYIYIYIYVYIHTPAEAGGAAAEAQAIYDWNNNSIGSHPGVNVNDIISSSTIHAINDLLASLKPSTRRSAKDRGVPLPT